MLTHLLDTLNTFQIVFSMFHITSNNYISSTVLVYVLNNFSLKHCTHTNYHRQDFEVNLVFSAR